MDRHAKKLVNWLQKGGVVVNFILTRYQRRVAFAFEVDVFERFPLRGVVRSIFTKLGMDNRALNFFEGKN